MCMSSPKTPKTPPATQEVKQPETTMLRRKKTGGMMAGGTLLTGPSGVANASLTTGAPTLLGG